MTVKEQILQELFQAKGQYYSGEQLAEKMHVTRAAVWKAIKTLQKEGYTIVSKKKLGYALSDFTDYLDETQITTRLTTTSLGSTIVILPEISSTNTYLKSKIQEGAKHGTVVVADSQTAGKGRQGRNFISPKGSGLYFSVLISKKLPMRDAPLLTACAAVASARAIDRLYGANTKIKWVNDLFLNGKKICGILTEGIVSLESGYLEHAVIGIGINVRNALQYLPEELTKTVTSLEDALSVDIDRNALLAAILNELEVLIQQLPKRTFLSEYRSRSNLIGKTAEYVTDNGTVYRIQVLGIQEDCSLLVQSEDGQKHLLHAGDVHLGSSAFAE